MTEHCPRCGRGPDAPCDCQPLPRRTPTLHIYGQSQWHDTAYLSGTREALQRLRDTIDAAMRDGAAGCCATVTDGEGYRVIVECADEDTMRASAVPYHDEIAKDYMNRLGPWSRVGRIPSVCVCDCGEVKP